MSGETTNDRDQKIAAAKSAMKRSLDSYGLTTDESVEAIAELTKGLAAESEAPNAISWRMSELLEQKLQPATTV